MVAKWQRQAARALNAHDRDTRSWAEERKLDSRFAAARAAGRKRSAEEPSDGERLAALGLIGG